MNILNLIQWAWEGIQCVGIGASFFSKNKDREKREDRLKIAAATNVFPPPKHKGGNTYELFYSGPKIRIWGGENQELPTNCILHVPNNLTGRIEETKENGFIVIEQGIEPGFSGQVYVKLKNTTIFPRRVFGGEKIAEISFNNYIKPTKDLKK